MSIVSSAFTEEGLRRLPAPIVQKLHQLIARVRRIAIVKGTFAVAATALICLLAIMAVYSQFTIFSAGARWALSLGALAITGFATWWWIFRPATKKVTLTAIARFVEERHPELQETISSSVELLASDDPDDVKGSKELIGEVVKSALKDVSTVSPKEEFDTKPIRQAAQTALILAGILTLIVVIWPKPATRLIMSALAPFAEIGNAYADTLKVTPGDIRVAAGKDLTIEMTIKHRRIDRATVRRKDAGQEQEGVERMDLTSTGEDGVKTFTRTFPNVQTNFQYRVHAGNALSRTYNVEVVEPPAVQKLTIRYEYPPYTGLPVKEEVSTTGEITAVENTVITVTSLAQRPLKEAILTIGSNQQKALEPEAGETRAPGETKWRFTLNRGHETGADWTIHLKDEYGFENEPIYYHLKSVRDQAPTITLTAPETKELRLRPTEFLPILYNATEDYGFGEASLQVKLDGREPAIPVGQELPRRNAAGSNEWSGTGGLDLSTLQLDAVRTVSVQMRLADNLPPQYKGAQVAVSSPIIITIDRGAKTLAEQTFEAQEREIREELERTKQDLREAKQREQDARNRIEREKEATPETLQQMDAARKELAEAEERIQDLAERMEQTVFSERAQEMMEIAEKDIKPAREAAENVALTDDKKKRVEAAKAAEKEIDEAVRNIDEVLKNLQESRQQVEQVAELSKMATEQRRLASEAMKTAEKQMEQAQQLAQQQAQQKMDPQSPQAQQQQEQLERQQEQQMQQWQQEQLRVQRELAEMLKNDPQALKEVLKQQQANAEQLSKQAQQLAKEQEALRMTAKQAADANKMEPLTEELVKQLQEAQEKIAEQSAAVRAQMAQNNPQMQEANEAMREAAKDAQDAAKELSKENLAAAKEAAKEAAQGFEQLAKEAAEQAAQAMDAEAMAKKQQEQMAQNNPQGQQPQNPEMAQNNPQGQQPQNPEMAQNNPQGQQPQNPQMQQNNPKGQQPQNPEMAQNNPQGQQPQNPEMAQNNPQGQQPQNPEMAQNNPQGQQPQNPEMAQNNPQGQQPQNPQMAQNNPQGQQPQNPQMQNNPQGQQPQNPQMAQNNPQGQQPQNPQMAQNNPQGQNPQNPQGQKPQAGMPVDPMLASELANLEDRQKRVSETLEAIKKGQMEEALSMLQEDIAADAKMLAKQADALEQASAMARQNQAQAQAARAESQFQNAMNQSQAAEQQLMQAQEQQDRAQAAPAQQAAMAQGMNPQQAQEQAMQQAKNGQLPAAPPAGDEQRSLANSEQFQQRSQQALNEASQQLAQAAKQLGQQANQIKPTQKPPQNTPLMAAQDLAQSFDQLSQAAQAQDAMQAASQAMQAAQSLQQMAQQAAQNMGAMRDSAAMQAQQQQPGQPGQPQMAGQPNDQTETGADVDSSGVPPELEKLGISAADWARMKGSLQSGAANQGGTGAPEEYQNLVNQYFRIIAQEARRKEP